ncbi:MAG: hypothetical protein V1766_04220, partial [Pseudomonadota bacterium]
VASRLDKTLDGLLEIHPLVRIGSVGLREHVTAELIRGDFRKNLSIALIGRTARYRSLGLRPSVEWSHGFAGGFKVLDNIGNVRKFPGPFIGDDHANLHARFHGHHEIRDGRAECS